MIEAPTVDRFPALFFGQALAKWCRANLDFRVPVATVKLETAGLCCQNLLTL